MDAGRELDVVNPNDGGDVSAEDEAKVAGIIEAADRGRLTHQGGYPSDWKIENGTVYWADVTHDGQPHLVAMPVDEFIDEYGNLREDS